MKDVIRLSLKVSFLLAFVLLLGCAAAALAQGAPDLISNGSFETLGGPSLAGWEQGNPELTAFASPGAPGGGDWSLQLEVDWAPSTAFVTQRIEGLRDGDIIELRADVKGVGQFGGGSLSLVVGDAPWSAPAKSAVSSSGTWTTLSVVDTLELDAGDSVWVKLSALPVEVAPAGNLGLFDSVSLTTSGPIPVVPLTWGAVKARYE